jgi:hypothetical protein
MSDTAATPNPSPTTADATTRPPRPSTAVVEALAAAEGVDPADLETPLFEYVDPDALDALFSGPAPAQSGSVSFLVGNRRVTVAVAADDAVEVRVEAPGATPDHVETVAEERRDP